LSKVWSPTPLISPSGTGKPWGWPFIDILWLRPINNDVVEDTSNGERYQASLFQLNQRMLFEGESFSAPLSGKEIIQQVYPFAFRVAVPAWYDHMRERSLFNDAMMFTVPLVELASMYPVLLETLPILNT
jgi:hypothetical protein